METIKEKISLAFFFAVLVFVLFASAKLLVPFFGPIVCAIVAAIIFHPMHRFLQKKLPRWAPSATAGLSDFLVFLLFVAPIALLIWAVVEEADKVVPTVQNTILRFLAWFRSNPLQELSWLPASLKRQLDFSSTLVQDRVANIGNKSFAAVAAFGTALASNTFGAIFDTFIFLFVLFFMFRDGVSLFNRITHLLPLGTKDKNQINERVRMTVVGVVRATFITAIAQGAVATIGFLLAKAQGAFLLGFLTALCTFIPSVGTAIISLPVAAFYLATGEIGKGLFVLGWGILVVGVVDNLLRPIIAGDKAEMPFLWLFFALLGGIQVFGALGVIVGPLIFALAAALLDIYEQQFLSNRRSAQS